MLLQMVVLLEDALVVLPPAVDLRNATSAAKWATLPVTALRPVDTPKEVMAAVSVAMAEETEAKLAIHVVDTDTCRETAPRVRNATTAETLAISAVTALRRFRVRDCATDARSRVTCRLSAPRLE